MITVRHAELAGITPEMLLWWYGHIEGDMPYAGSTWPRFLVWHPLDHISYEVLEPDVSRRIRPGTRVRLRQVFQRDPRRLIDIIVEVEALAADCVVVHMQVAGEDVMRIIYELHAVARGTRYVTRMEIGVTGLPAALGLNALVRRRVLRGAMAHVWARHHVEEIGNLPNFLPELWAAESGLTLFAARH